MNLFRSVSDCSGIVSTRVMQEFRLKLCQQFDRGVDNWVHSQVWDQIRQDIEERV